MFKPTLSLLALCAATTLFADPVLPYRDASLPIEARVTDLLSRMTLEEKAAQLTGTDDVNKKCFNAQGNFVSAKAEPLFKHGMGQLQQVIRNSYMGPKKSAQAVNALQKYFVEETRLGIPAIFSEECLHGLMGEGATVFPQAIAMSGMWDTELMHRIYTAIALEARSRGTGQALTPMIDIAREPRWGRLEESYGEDTFLTSRLAVAAITGFQGKGPLIDGSHIAATAKHFAAHGAPEGGLNEGAVHVGERELREIYLPPFRAAVTEAHVKCIMPAYHEIDGIPCHANHWLLTDVLRKEWGFTGVVVSDYSGITQLNSLHRVAPTKAEAGQLALNAGVNVELSDVECYTTLPDMVQDGRISQETLDHAVADILRLKFELGLFERPYADPDAAERISNNPEHRQLAREAARKAIVLLKNEKALLPLDPAKIKKLAVIGPNANRHLYGGYTVKTQRGISVLEGLQELYGPKMTIQYAEGCKIHVGDGHWKSRGKIIPNDPDKDRALIAEAVKIATESDAVVVVVGDDSQISSESRDMHDLSLVGRQEELLMAVLNTGKPVIMVLINGRPITLNTLAQKAPAILEAWYPGEEGGRAVAEVIFGAVNPSGHLTVSFPRSIGQLPVYYNHKPREAAYVMDDAAPLYAFGHGLSYSNFSYGKPLVTPAKTKVGETAQVSVKIKNDSARAGDEVVQLYARAKYSSVGRGMKALKGFQRVSLQPGETKTVTFELTPTLLSTWDARMREVVEPGIFDLMVGGSSDKVETVQLEVMP